MSVLEEIEQAIKSLRGGPGASVVGVGQQWGVGSGVVVAKGHVLTNAHNVRHEAVEVTFADGRTAEGRVAGIDVDGDIAVLSVETADVPAVAWAGAHPEIGDAVFAISNPGGRGVRVSFGFVSGTERRFRGPRGRQITGSIEHTAPLLPGSSGGPVVDKNGALLGINTNRLGEGFYLSIPADETLRGRVDALSRGESAEPPRLGIGIAPAHVAKGLRRAVGLPDTDGLLVRFVEDGSPAEGAGIAEGDLITEAGGRNLTSADELHDALTKAGRGASIELKVVRGTSERVVAISLN
ncbi:MAG: S1C family serine protease [Actinomycetota bacterium]|nr:S1C family serine protease [Actinomycetota bacterium]